MIFDVIDGIYHSEIDHEQLQIFCFYNLNTVVTNKHNSVLYTNLLLNFQVEGVHC